MATYDNAKPILPKHGSLVLTDNSGTPKVLTVPFSEAVSFAGLSKGGQSWAIFRNRGANISAVPTGNKESTVIKCKVQVPIFTHATEYTLLDWMRRTGALTGLTSTLGAEQGGDETYTYKCKFVVDRTDFGTDPSIEYNFCVIEIDDITEGGSDEEAMMASVTITALHIGADESAWMTVT